MIKLYFSANSPYVRKVRVVMLEKDIPFELEPMELADPPASFLAANPNRRVPAIEDNGTVLFESNLILEYLLTKYPRPGKDTPPMGASMVRDAHRWEDLSTLNVIETTLNSGLNLRQMRVSGIEPEQAAYLQAEHRRIQSNLDWLELRATPEGFVPGEFSILDLNLVCALEWATFRDQFPWRGRPKLDAIMARYRERESLRTTRPGQ